MVGQAGNQREERSVSPSNCEGANGRDTMILKDGFRRILTYIHISARKRVNGSSRAHPVRVAALKTTVFTGARSRRQFPQEDRRIPVENLSRIAALLPLALSQSKRFSGVALRAGVRVVARQNGPGVFPIFSRHDLAARLSSTISKK